MKKSGESITTVIQHSDRNILNFLQINAGTKLGVEQTHVDVRIHNVQRQLPASAETSLFIGSDLKGGFNKLVGMSTSNNLGSTITTKTCADSIWGSYEGRPSTS